MTGVVPADPASGTPIQCQIKPLAHAALPLDAVLKVEADMRPFLAFSVPPGTYERNYLPDPSSP